MSLQEALRLAATENYQILIAQQQREEARQGTRSARLPYRPVLVLSTSGQDGTLIVGAQTGSTPLNRRSVSYSGAVQWSTPLGTALELSAGASDQLAGAFGPPYSTSMALSMVQPLLRGGWESGAFTPALQADVDAEIQTQVLRGSVNDLLVQVESAYWELAYAQEDLKIKTRSLERAQKQFDDTQENIRRGLLAEPTIYVIEENLVFFKAQLNSAGESLTLARSALARLLQLPVGTPLVASDALDRDLEALPPLEEASARALSENPSWHIDRLEAQRARLSLAFEANRAMPSLDLSASFALNGLADSRGDSWAQVASAEQPEVRLGLVFEVPLGEDARLARERSARAARQRRLLDLKDTETALRYQVRDLLTSLQAQEERLVLRQRQVELARLKLEAEEERYRSGISDLDAVARFQRDLDTALINERRARVSLLVSRSRLLRAQGTLHRAYGIEVQ